jgi:HEAT repeat protein
MTKLIGICICLFVVGCSEAPLTQLIFDLREADDVLVRRAAARALGELGSEATSAVSALEEALADDDREVCRLACYALGEVGPQAKAALPALTKSLQDEEFSMRLAAAFAIQKINPDSEAYVSELTRAMRMGEGGTIVSVGQLGPSATWAVPTLIELLKDHRPGIRRLAAEALGQIAVNAEGVESALRGALRDQDDRVRQAAQKALETLRRPTGSQ